MKCQNCGAESTGALCPKCSAEQSEIPIPASFFSPEESAGRHTFTLSDDAGSSGGFTITAASLQIEAVSPETPEASAPLPELDLPQTPKPAPKQPVPAPEPPKQPAPAPRRTSAAPPAASAAAEPIQTPQGFYLVPYDESLWATLSRIRHRWLLPVLVGIIFIAGMTFGIMMAKSAAKKQPSADNTAVTTAPQDSPAPSLMAAAQLKLYFSQELLPKYGYLPSGSEISAEAEGVLSVFCADKRMTMLRVEADTLKIEQYQYENDKIKALDPVDFPELSKAVANSEQEITIIGNASGIFFGERCIAESGLGTAESDPPATLCVCRKISADSVSYTDLTGIRDDVGDASDWEGQYIRLVRSIAAELPQDDSGCYRFVQIDGDDIPELEIRLSHSDGTASAQLYTFADNAPQLLTTEADAAAYECAPAQNCYRETLNIGSGTGYNWYHIADGKAVCDHTERMAAEDGEWIYYLDGEPCPSDMFYNKTDPDASVLEKNPEFTPIR